MKKLIILTASALVVVAFVAIAAIVVKPMVYNALDYFVRQPILAIRDAISAEKADQVTRLEEAQTSTDAMNQAWKLVTPDAGFHPRDGAFVASFKGYMWLTNGYNPEEIPNPIYRSKDGRDWEIAVDIAPWPRRHLGGFVVLNDRLFMIGGDFHTDVWSSSDGVNWRQEPDGPWGKRYNPYIGVYDGKIWLMGGQTFDGPKGESCNKPYCLSHAYNDVWSSSDGQTWERVTSDAAWEPRALISGFAVHDGAMWILGGGVREIVPFEPSGPVAETRIDYSDVWKSTDGKTWTNVTYRAQWPARSHLSVVGFDNHLIVNDGSAGLQGNLQSDTWASTNGKDWIRIGDSGQIPRRHASSLVVHEGDLFLIAGLLHNDVWKLDKSVLSRAN